MDVRCASRVWDARRREEVEVFLLHELTRPALVLGLINGVAQLG